MLSTASRVGPSRAVPQRAGDSVAEPLNRRAPGRVVIADDQPVAAWKDLFAGSSASRAARLGGSGPALRPGRKEREITEQTRETRRRQHSGNLQ